MDGPLICPCGIARVDCDYHKPEDEGLDYHKPENEGLLAWLPSDIPESLRLELRKVFAQIKEAHDRILKSSPWLDDDLPTSSH